MMFSNSFALTPEDIENLEANNDAQTFLNRETQDLFFVKEEDEVCEDRVIHGFGNTCPLDLVDVLDPCKDGFP